MSWTDLKTLLHQEGYRNVRELPDGRVIATANMITTTGLFVNLNRYGYEYRYCYEYEGDARVAAQTWDGKGDPPGPWIKLKGLWSGERLGPGALA